MFDLLAIGKQKYDQRGKNEAIKDKEEAIRFKEQQITLLVNDVKIKDAQILSYQKALDEKIEVLKNSDLQSSLNDKEQQIANLQNLVQKLQSACVSAQKNAHDLEISNSNLKNKIQSQDEFISVFRKEMGVMQDKLNVIKNGLYCLNEQFNEQLTNLNYNAN